MLLGAHQSIAGGVSRAFARAEKDGAESLQVFTKNARGWAAKPLEQPEVEAFRKEAKRTGLPVIAHASYLTNLGSENEEIRAKSLAGFSDELERCERLGIQYLVLHPGANPDLDRGISLIAEGLDHGLRAVPGEVQVLLEITAGQGNSIGHRFEHLARIIEKTRAADRVAICLDTCHLYMAGYDIGSRDGYKRTLAELDVSLGMERVKAIHLNDCKKPFGARVDRHESIGKGTLGTDVFRWLVNEPSFRSTVGVLETPNFEAYAEELELLRGLRTRKRASTSRPASGRTAN